MSASRQSVWLQSPKADVYFQLRISRNTLIAAAISLLVHVLLLFFLSRQHLLDRPQPMDEAQQPLTIQLQSPKQPQAEPQPQTTPPVAEIPPPQPVKPKPAAKSFRREPPRTVIAKRPEAAPPAALPTPIPTPNAPPPPPPAATPKPALDPSQFPDMAAYVKAMREQRHLAGQDPDRVNEEAAARERGPSEDDIRMANLKRNMQPPGTNGVFQILSMDSHTAQFAFRGWKNDFSLARREVYQVDAGIDEDIQRIVVRKMIEIIRRYYTGDFNWESPRLGRVIVLSARPEDNAGLEDFMIQEFFGRGGLVSR